MTDINFRNNREQFTIQIADYQYQFDQLETIDTMNQESSENWRNIYEDLKSEFQAKYKQVSNTREYKKMMNMRETIFNSEINHLINQNEQYSSQILKFARQGKQQSQKNQRVVEYLKKQHEEAIQKLQNKLLEQDIKHQQQKLKHQQQTIRSKMQILGWKTRLQNSNRMYQQEINELKKQIPISSLSLSLSKSNEIELKQEMREKQSLYVQNRLESLAENKKKLTNRQFQRVMMKKPELQILRKIFPDANERCKNMIQIIKLKSPNKCRRESMNKRQSQRN